MSYTLNQIVRRIRTIAQAHVQINTVYYGTVPALLQKEDIRYPAVCFYLESSSIAQKKEQFPFQLYIIDRLNTEDEDHELEIHSDALSISTDFVAKMMDQVTFDWMLSDGVSRTLFADAVNTPDRTAGLLMEFTLSTNLRTDRCLAATSFHQRIFGREFGPEFE